MTNVKIKFWGVRGSIASPLTAMDVDGKNLEVLKAYHDSMSELTNGTLVDPEEFFRNWKKSRPPATYGGNTSCVQVSFGEQIFVLDMGTGLRCLGDSVMGEVFKKKGVEVHFLLSHVHWDHIQGLPFFAPIYLSKFEHDIHNKWRFHGGTNWQKSAAECIAAQMNSPSFPVAWETIKEWTEEISSSTMIHRKQIEAGDLQAPKADRTLIEFGQLEHPQETYGFRLVFPGDRVVVYTTDNEPRNPLRPDKRLLRLAHRAHVLITDCQYTEEQYEGDGPGGVSRHGWGHSYPEAVAKTAVMAEVGILVLFHHDPNSSDKKVTEMVKHTQKLIDDDKARIVDTKVIGAWEGLELTL